MPEVRTLAGIAYPSYRDRVLRSARAEGRAALLDAAALQEQYFLDNKTYTATLAERQVAAATVNTRARSVARPRTARSRPAVLRATPEGGQADDLACADLTLDSNGTKTASGSEPTTCWRQQDAALQGPAQGARTRYPARLGSRSRNFPDPCDRPLHERVVNRLVHQRGTAVMRRVPRRVRACRVVR